MTVSLKKEMQEMQEWITQAEEDYLESDFHYKTPEELHTAVEELKVCLFAIESLAFKCHFLKNGFIVSYNVKETKVKYLYFRNHTLLPLFIFYFHQNNLPLITPLYIQMLFSV